jgi:hypothetical protein
MAMAFMDVTGAVVKTEQQQIEGLVRLLRTLEWSEQDECDGPDYTKTYYRCPECHYQRVEGGHSWQCQLAQCLDFYEGKYK